MKPTMKQLLARIEQLEKELAVLKASQRTEHHHHYHPQPLIGQPQPTYTPGWPTYPTVVCGPAGNVGAFQITYGPDH